MSEVGAAIGSMCILVIVILALEVLLLWFWIWTLVDCVKNEHQDDNTRILWIIVIAAAGFIGALIYYFVRRPERLREEWKSGFEQVKVKEKKEKETRSFQSEEEDHVKHSQKGIPICPQCGIELEFSELPEDCPYCGILLK